MPEPDVQLGGTSQGQTYGEIVWRQFRKKPYAVIALCMIGLLFVICVFAPFLASNRPFVMRVAGVTSYPLFEFMTRQDWLVLSAFVCFWMGFTAWRVLRRRLLRRQHAHTIAFGSAAALLLLSAVPILLFVVDRLDNNPSHHYRQTAEAPGVWAVFPPVPFSHDGQFLNVQLMSSSDRLDLKTIVKRQHKAIDDELYQSLQFAKVNFPDPAVFARRKAQYEADAARKKRSSSARAAITVERANRELPRHYLGTDKAGRDVLSRMIWATRTSLAVGFIAVGIAALIGCSLGAVAGYFGKTVDIIVMRIVEIVMCFPRFFLILTIIAFWGRGLTVIMVAIGLTGWTGYTRFVRAEFLRLRRLDFAVSARALGLGHRRIMFRHLLPNALTPVLISATFGVAAAVLTEAGISFLGLGDVSAPSWGDLLMQARENFSPMLAWPSTLAILITVVSYNLVGDSLRDALDPKLRV